VQLTNGGEKRNFPFIKPLQYINVLITTFLRISKHFRPFWKILEESAPKVVCRAQKHFRTFKNEYFSEHNQKSSEDVLYTKRFKYG